MTAAELSVAMEHATSPLSETERGVNSSLALVKALIFQHGRGIWKELGLDRGHVGMTATLGLVPLYEGQQRSDSRPYTSLGHHDRDVGCSPISSWRADLLRCLSIPDPGL